LEINNLDKCFTKEAMKDLVSLFSDKQIVRMVEQVLKEHPDNKLVKAILEDLNG